MCSVIMVFKILKHQLTFLHVLCFPFLNTAPHIEFFGTLALYLSLTHHQHQRFYGFWIGATLKSSIFKPEQRKLTSENGKFWKY